MKIALTIAGSDSGGGAGIQADLKTFNQFKVFGTSVITAITAQNTKGVRAVHPVPPEIVRAQLEALAEDLPPAGFKTGMLATSELVRMVAGVITEFDWPNYVCDPVMVATSGDRLLDADAEAVMRENLVPLATLVTPNLDEAAILTGSDPRDPESMEQAGRRLLELGASAALVVTSAGVRNYRHPRINTRSTHGTGCTLSAAITAGLATGRDVESAVTAGLDFVFRAMKSAPALGFGRGPLDHTVRAS
jgi:hydroxymethylpyrimidine/phosphomethylpyrimidine kinase